MSKSTSSRRAKQSSHQDAKPYPEFPLTAHATGRWCKKHRGERFYFGSLKNGWETALKRYEREWPFIIAGKTVPPANEERKAEDGPRLADVCNEFLNAKRRKVDSGEQSPRSLPDYLRTTDKLIAEFGRNVDPRELTPADFGRYRSKLAKRFGPVTLRNEISRVRAVFAYAAKVKLIDRPVDCGESFDKPPAKALRKARYEAGPRMFEAEEIRRILDALDGKEVVTSKSGKKITEKADPVMKAFVLLGVNCAFGNTDCANLPRQAVDLTAGWITFPRPKTFIPRRCPLWPETVKALDAALALRPKPADAADADLCFLTVRGQRWVRVKEHSTKAGRVVPVDPLGQRFTKLLKKLEINGRNRLGFYSLRHVFATIGGNAKDPDALRAIMGHVDSSMTSHYREGIADDRLRAVVDVVRRWIWPEGDENLSNVLVST